MKRKIYRTRRLILRPFILSDFSKWKKAHEIAAPAQDKFDLNPLPAERCTKYEFKELLMRQRRNEKADRLYVWNVFLRKTGAYIGRIDIATIIREPYEMANLGYYIINIYCGKGYAKEALKKLIPAGLHDLKFHRLEAIIDTDNFVSIKVAKKVGLYREGIKKHYWFQNKRWEDQVAFIATPELFNSRIKAP